MQRKKTVGNCIIAVGIGGLFLLQFLLHRSVPFMMDDIWYGTNLATGDALQGLGDVLEGQVWHYLNWGGRSITHGILQMVIMQGELVADILNLGMTLLLCYLTCVIAGARHPFWFLTAAAMMVACNANCKMSMFWQAGTVNYVYSTAWIFLFIWVYLRELEENAGKLPAVGVWMIPLGLMTGWSNENMGPACFLLSCGVSVYLVLRKKRRLSVWMIEGMAMSLVGSLLVVVAPGNFVRSATIEKVSMGEEIYNRFCAMLCASVEYLFPALFFLSFVLLLYKVWGKGTLRPCHRILLMTGVLAHGAMILSPHYPDRATFGIMMLGIALILSLLSELVVQRRKVLPYLVAAVSCIWLYAIYVIGGYLYFAEEIVAGQ